MGCVVDGGSSTNVLNEDVLSSLRVEREHIQPCSTTFVGPCSENLHVVGRVNGISVVIGGVRVLATFTVLRLQKKGYPALLGQPWLESVMSMHDWDAGTLTLGPSVHRVTVALHPIGQIAGIEKDMKVLQALEFESSSDDDEEVAAGSNDESGSSSEADDSDGTVYSIQAIRKIWQR